MKEKLKNFQENGKRGLFVLSDGGKLIATVSSVLGELVVFNHVRYSYAGTIPQYPIEYDEICFRIDAVIGCAEEKTP